MRAWKVVIPPERNKPALRTHEGYEWLYVLSGRMRLILAEHDITMEPGSPTPATQGPVVDRSDQFEVNGSREGRPAFTLKARSVTGFAGDRKFLQGVELLIHDDRGGDVKVSGIEGQFDVSDRRARLSGNTD